MRSRKESQPWSGTRFWRNTAGRAWLYQAFAGQVFGDVAAVLFVFSSVGSFARYRTDRDRFFLGMGIFTGVLCLGCLGWYLWHTL